MKMQQNNMVTLLLYFVIQLYKEDDEISYVHLFQELRFNIFILCQHYTGKIVSKFKKNTIN